MSHYIFTSESVSRGHPDKVADQISDAVLDALIGASKKALLPVEEVRCACETLIRAGLVVVAGEARQSVERKTIDIDVPQIVKRVTSAVDYEREAHGFDPTDHVVLQAISRQSGDIAQGVDRQEDNKIGAGDQGLMFGYACRETPELMPAAISLARNLMQKHWQVRKQQHPWLGPDAKAQVSLCYDRHGDMVTAEHVQDVVLSSQHREGMSQREVRQAIIEDIVRPVLDAAGKSMPEDDHIHINPTGKFVDGGPKSDCGLTGRKIIVDTYGGSAPHGGGAFSGKDPTKVDRSASYLARYIAKNIVAAGLADRCLVQLAYAIGKPEPVSFMVKRSGDTESRLNNTQLEQRVREIFDLTPAGIIQMLDLWQPIYEDTAANGHFGREALPWEKVDKVDDLRY